MNIGVNRNVVYENPVSETKPNDSYSIELVTGTAATDLLFNDHWFQKSWDTLFASCTWATVFQSRSFVTAWYQVYGDKHLPILINAVEKGQLKGVLPMVLLREGRITGAGHYDAEYQTWLATPADGDTFIQKALTELMKQFPGHPISFRFLPPNTPLTWIKENKKWRTCSIVQSHARPLIHLNDPETNLGGKHFRHKLNRLKKSGEVRFETITDVNSFENGLHEMAMMYDFRQSALFNKNHFKEDPLKKDFLLELFRLQLLHITVLKVNAKIIAAVVGVLGKDDWLHLAGFNCHAPFKARLYSPGYLHFVLLSKQMIKEQVQYFDLTPGYDAYKEELANRHDEVMEMVISSERKYRIKKRLRKWMHARLIAIGVRPMTADLKLKKLLYLVRHRSAMSVIKRLAKSLYKKRKQKLFLIQTYTLKSAINISLHKDSLHDLLEFETSKGMGITRWEFLSDAMYRFEKGQHCFTWIENGRLLCCVWFNYPETDEVDIVLESVYCHAAVKDQLSSFLNCVAIEVAVTREKNSIHILADEKLF